MHSRPNSFFLRENYRLRAMHSFTAADLYCITLLAKCKLNFAASAVADDGTTDVVMQNNLESFTEHFLKLKAE